MSPKSNERKEERSQRREVEIDRGVYVVKGAAPKAGTKLTRDRVSDNFRSLNGHGRGPDRSTGAGTAGG